MPQKERPPQPAVRPDPNGLSHGEPAASSPARLRTRQFTEHYGPHGISHFLSDHEEHAFQRVRWPDKKWRTGR